MPVQVTRSLNAALGRQIDSLGEKMAFYVNALADMEARRDALKRELANVHRAIQDSKEDCGTYEQNCDKLHHVRYV